MANFDNRVNFRVEVAEVRDPLEMLGGDVDADAYQLVINTRDACLEEVIRCYQTDERLRAIFRSLVTRRSQSNLPDNESPLQGDFSPWWSHDTVSLRYESEWAAGDAPANSLFGEEMGVSSIIEDEEEESLGDEEHRLAWKEYALGDTDYYEWILSEQEESQEQDLLDYDQVEDTGQIALPTSFQYLRRQQRRREIATLDRAYTVLKDLKMVVNLSDILWPECRSTTMANFMRSRRHERELRVLDYMEGRLEDCKDVVLAFRSSDNAEPSISIELDGIMQLIKDIRLPLNALREMYVLGTPQSPWDQLEHFVHDRRLGIPLYFGYEDFDNRYDTMPLDRFWGRKFLEKSSENEDSWSHIFCYPLIGMTVLSRSLSSFLCGPFKNGVCSFVSALWHVFKHSCIASY